MIPSHDLVGVINGWNVFGVERERVLPAFLQALLQSSGHPRRVP